MPNIRPIIKNLKSLLITSVLCGVCTLALFAGRMDRVSSAPANLPIVPSPPPEQVLAKCLAFSRPIKLKVEKLSGSMVSKKVKPLWAYAYSAEKQTIVLHSVELYKARAFMGKQRGEFKKMLEKQEKDREPYKGNLSNVSSVEIRPGGRKVYFAVVGFGPGGAFSVVFTTIGKYDLVLTQLASSEDDLPDKERIKNPSMPTSVLTAAFKQLEHSIPNLSQTH